jgi:hypothetical protein
LCVSFLKFKILLELGQNDLFVVFINLLLFIPPYLLGFQDLLRNLFFKGLFLRVFLIRRYHLPA